MDTNQTRTETLTESERLAFRRLPAETDAAYANRMRRYRASIEQHKPHSPLARRAAEIVVALDPEQAAADRAHTIRLLDLAAEIVATRRVTHHQLEKLEQVLAFARLENAIQPLRDEQRPQPWVAAATDLLQALDDEADVDDCSDGCACRPNDAMRFQLVATPLAALVRAAGGE